MTADPPDIATAFRELAGFAPDQDAATAVGLDVRGSIDQATNAASQTITETITTGTAKMDGAIAEAFRLATGQLNDAAGNLRSGATENRDRFITEWQDLAAKATSETLDERVKTEAARSRRATIGTFGAALAIAALAFGVATFVAHRQGWQNGYRTGQADLLTHLHNQKTRAAWANTPDGKLAFQLYNAGSIRLLATCNQPGWDTETRHGKPICFPEAAKDGTTYGWFLK